jgi:aspartyl-tRNA(Asn)/glutamyl-tRNA(Gln) amidotransferase subunit C
MVQVDETLTRKVAELARLELSEKEVTTFTAQLGEILRYLDQLGTAEISGVEPMTHPLELESPLREDECKPSPVDSSENPKVLASAPEVIESGFKVPPIL